jgi:hypothetical protein
MRSCRRCRRAGLGLEGGFAGVRVGDGEGAGGWLGGVFLTVPAAGAELAGRAAGDVDVAVPVVVPPWPSAMV